MYGSMSIVGCVMLIALSASNLPVFEKDLFTTSGGDLEITFIGHGTLMFRFGDQIVHVDPFSRLADYSSLPDADLILITHGHGDHLDQEAVAAIRRTNTRIVVAPACEGRVAGASLLKNGEIETWAGVEIEAVPAYNLVHMRSEGQPFHPRGEGNGYVLSFGDTRVYIAGDTENVPEMSSLKDVDIAFLPMNLPYTMTPEMVAEAARSFRPGVLYPYHYGETDPDEVVALLADEKGIEVRIRAMR